MCSANTYRYNQIPRSEMMMDFAMIATTIILIIEFIIIVIIVGFMLVREPNGKHLSH